MTRLQHGLKLGGVHVSNWSMGTSTTGFSTVHRGVVAAHILAVLGLRAENVFPPSPPSSPSLDEFV